MKPDLQAIQERVDKATDGHWKVEKYYHEEPYKEFIKSAAVVTERDKEGCQYTITRNNWSNPLLADLDFIVHARQDIPALLAYIEQLEAERQWISCRDRLPENGRPIDVWIVENNYGRRSIDAEYDAEERLFDTDEGDYEADDGTEIDGIVTHWMYRPADPVILPPLPGTEGEK
ncbi:DUF551 domain-containing protein [Sporomusa paucivorans]|uniref:DUF551 domain-containing protein n=1 Tax=Sporomusa paucivorans TaxID=2376 RepID=UPI003570C14C